jgi:hypothetical protein
LGITQFFLERGSKEWMQVDLLSDLPVVLGYSQIFIG